MKVSKKFRWEGAHRLPWHQEGCQHLHGHSYLMWVELEGEPDAQGMVIDFKEIKSVIKPLIEAWDHATLVAEDDHKLRKALTLLESKHYVLPYDSSSENVCRFVIEYLNQHALTSLRKHRIERINVRLQETETCYAEMSSKVDLQPRTIHQKERSESLTF